MVTLIDWISLIFWVSRLFSKFLEQSAPPLLLSECQHSPLSLHRLLECSGAPYTRVLPHFCEKFSRIFIFWSYFLVLAFAQGLILLVHLGIGFQTPLFMRIHPLLFGNLEFSLLALKSLFVFVDLELTCCFLLLYLTEWKLLWGNPKVCEPFHLIFEVNFPSFLFCLRFFGSCLQFVYLRPSCLFHNKSVFFVLCEVFF